MSTQKITDAVLDDAIMRLRTGQLVAIPTETVYGLAADATNDEAVARIFETKGRPAFNPLIVHVASVDMAKRYVQWNDMADALSHFWPGPLTLILKRRDDSPISLLASAGGDTLAIRIPNHAIAQHVIAAFDGGIAAPSANRSGRVSPTRAYHVEQEFSDQALLVVDGGSCQIGVESTVVDCSGDVATILRPGAITAQQIAKCGVTIEGFRAEQGIRNPKSPGMLTSHYAPSVPVRLNATAIHADEALIAFGPNPLQGAARTLNLSEKGDVLEAAANLFSHLRSLDSPEYRTIAVMPVPEDGIGIAINDRLKRAAQ